MMRLVAALGRWPHTALALAFACVIGMYCTNRDMGGAPTAPRGDGHYRPVLARGDGHMLYLMARSTALDGDWRFDNDLARFGDPWNEPRTATGRKGIMHPIGVPLVWTPLLWLAQGGAVVANLVGADVPLHGYTLWHQRFVLVSSALAACVAIFLAWKIAASCIGGRWAPTYGAVAILFGTPILYYATYMPSYSHALDACACAAFLAYWATTLGRNDVRRALWLGALLGIAMLIRTQEAALSVCVLIEYGYRAVRAAAARDGNGAGRWLAGGVLIGCVALVVFIPQLIEWHVVYGTATQLPQGPHYTRFGAPMIAELLFSARNGWFSSHPLAYLATLGLAFAPKRARLVAIGFAAFVVIQVYLNSTVFDWWSSASFGQRRMCNATLPLVFGLTALIRRLAAIASRARRVPIAIWHGVAVLALAPFVAFNVARAVALRGGRPAPSALSPSCCDQFPGALRAIASAVYDNVGNPFQFPANAGFALRHGVDLQRWDRVVGNYPFIPPWTALSDAERPRHHGVLHIGSPESEALVVAGFSPPAVADRAFRWTTQRRATILVPNLVPYGQRLTLWLAPGFASHVELQWNGASVAAADLVGWTPVRFDLPDIDVHTNELTIVATPGVAPARHGWPEPATPVGVAVGDLEFALLTR